MKLTDFLSKTLGIASLLVLFPLAIEAASPSAEDALKLLPIQKSADIARPSAQERPPSRIC